MGDKKNFLDCAEIHLRNVQGREMKCAYFGSFFEEGDNAEQRCLLCEFPRMKESNYFTPKDAEGMCDFYRRGIPSKCVYSPNFPGEKEQLIQTLRETIERLEKGNH